MKKNGFTLVELLAVVTILSVLLLLVVPKIVNQLNNSKDEVNDVTKKLIYNATEKYIKDFNIDPKDTFCIPISDLERDEYLSSTVTDNKVGIDLKENKSVKINYDETSKYSYELTDKSECNKEMGMLGGGLVPVAYDGDNWVVVSQTNKNNEWYNYDEQKWANAAVLAKGVKKNPGDTVAVDGTEALMMFVWIPRYEYKYTNLGDQYAGGTQTEPGGIDINFISKETTTPSSNEYKIHPAFEFGGKQLSGIWVGKFELSHTTKSQGTAETDDSANLNCTTETCSEAKYLRILPNKASLRYNDVSSFFYAIRSIENTSIFGLSNVDTHMIKNSEWGAVAYLSQSKYGKYGNSDYTGINKEVYQNKSNLYMTGNSNGTPSQDQVNTQCEYVDIINRGNGLGACGAGASTTGNIYGVYDMSGGTHEFSMNVYTTSDGSYSGFNSENNSGFNGILYNNGDLIEKTDGVDFPIQKYYNSYTTNDASTACDGFCYGDALLETAGWYGDMSRMIDSSTPWFIRGGAYYGDYSRESVNGIFRYSYVGGIADYLKTTRVVFVEK